MPQGTKKVAILVADAFEQVEMTEPRKALEQSGAQARIVSPARGKVQGWNHFEKGDYFKTASVLDNARPEDFDALLLPGGAHNPDTLRMNPKAVQFVKRFCARRVRAKRPRTSTRG